MSRRRDHTLEEETALVTGASRGTGHQITLTLSRESATVIVNYNDSATKAEEVMKEVEATGGKAEAIQYNASDSESCGRMMADMVPRYSRLDILVNNTGITRDNLPMKMSEEDFDAVISMNLKGVLNCTKHTSYQMLKQKAGKIINISSVSGVLGNAGQINYHTAEAGVIDITKSAARELISGGITVNVVAPGFVATEITGILSDNVKAVATEQIPTKHFGNTQDIAETVVFLVSDKTGCITDQVLSVGNGMAMQGAPAYVPGCKRIGVRLV